MKKSECQKIAKEMLRALRLAYTALNTAPRFPVAGEDQEHNDSYKIAATVGKTIRKAEKKID